MSIEERKFINYKLSCFNQGVNVLNDVLKSVVMSEDENAENRFLISLGLVECLRLAADDVKVGVLQDE